MSHNFTFCVCSENWRETSVKHSKIHELSTIFDGLACKYTFLQNTEVVQGHALAGRRDMLSPGAGASPRRPHAKTADTPFYSSAYLLLVIYSLFKRNI